MCLQRKKVHGVLRGAVRSVSKRLAVHCIATPVLPLQRVFPQTMRPKQDRKLHSGLRQGQATRLSARRPAQRPATDWGRHTAAPDALKTGRCKQKFTEFNVLATQYDTEKMDRRLRQGQATRLSAHRPAQRAAGRKNPPFQIFCPIHILPFTVEGPPAPPPSSVPRALTGARRCCSHAGALVESIHLQNTNCGVANRYAPLWVRHADVDSTHQTLMGD